PGAPCFDAGTPAEIRAPQAPGGGVPPDLLVAPPDAWRADLPISLPSITRTAKRHLTAGQLGGDLVEVRHALGQLGHGEAVFVLYREDWLDPLALDFGQNALEVAAASPPRHVVRFQTVLVEILDVEGDDTAFELLDRLDGVDVGTHPVAGVAAGTDPLAVAL